MKFHRGFLPLRLTTEEQPVVGKEPGKVGVVGEGGLRTFPESERLQRGGAAPRLSVALRLLRRALPGLGCRCLSFPKPPCPPPQWPWVGCAVVTRPPVWGLPHLGERGR